MTVHFEFLQRMQKNVTVVTRPSFPCVILEVVCTWVVDWLGWVI